MVPLLPGHDGTWLNISPSGAVFLHTQSVPNCSLLYFPIAVTLVVFSVVAPVSIRYLYVIYTVP